MSKFGHPGGSPAAFFAAEQRNYGVSPYRWRGGRQFADWLS